MPGAIQYTDSVVPVRIYSCTQKDFILPVAVPVTGGETSAEGREAAFKSACLLTIHAENS